jgi:hypothetical protein
MASRKYIERRRKIASLKGKLGVLARQRKMLEHTESVYALVRVIEIRRADGSLAATWRVFATRDPAAPLCVDFGNELHRYMSVRRLAPLIARKMFESVNVAN